MTIIIINDDDDDDDRYACNKCQEPLEEACATHRSPPQNTKDTPTVIMMIMTMMVMMVMMIMKILTTIIIMRPHILPKVSLRTFIHQFTWSATGQYYWSALIDSFQQHTNAGTGLHTK